MDEQTLIALNGSIAKWREIECSDGYDLGMHNCPLCDLHYYDDEDENKYCSNCPIKLATGRSHCNNSPYATWHKALEQYRRDNKFSIGRFLVIAWTDVLAEIAREEREFLESLLPGGSDG